MASIVWDSQGVIMIDHLELGRMINDAYYAVKLRRLRQKIARKGWGKLTHGILLLQDKAPANTSQITISAASKCGFEILPHPPYSPDMAPFNYYLLQKLKSNLCDTQYWSNEGTIEAVNEYLWDQEKVFYFEGMGKLE